MIDIWDLGILTFNFDLTFHTQPNLCFITGSNMFMFDRDVKPDTSIKLEFFLKKSSTDFITTSG